MEVEVALGIDLRQLRGLAPITDPTASAAANRPSKAMSIRGRRNVRWFFQITSDTTTTFAHPKLDG
jgi:hypothetical protein